jgi:hypothetical protein
MNRARIASSTGNGTSQREKMQSRNVAALRAVLVVSPIVIRGVPHDSTKKWK